MCSRDKHGVSAECPALSLSPSRRNQSPSPMTNLGFETTRIATSAKEAHTRAGRGRVHRGVRKKERDKVKGESAKRADDSTYQSTKNDRVRR
jgi:hypothetical protein